MWPYPKVLAHRGAGRLAPENTLAALRRGLEYGFRAVEFDVMLSADDVPLLMHDVATGRTTDSTGRICDMAWQDIARLDAGSWYSREFAGEGVPRYEEAMAFCKRNGIWMNVEIKPAPGFEKRTGQVVAEYTSRFFTEASGERRQDEKQDPGLPLLSSFSLDALLAAKTAGPRIPRAYLVDAIPADWQQHLERLEAMALHVNHRTLTQQQAQAVKRARYGLFCYTVNSLAQARRLLDWGVDAFCTDRIDLFPPDFS